MKSNKSPQRFSKASQHRRLVAPARFDFFSACA
jgi:hypothetical protein